ncbi:MAG: hypothetical protein FD180_4355 [Planctomycetota bacterium]|nr:MAG: hypothetical protein FD180_4355 [Planctomycetota bacterium]
MKRLVLALAVSCAFVHGCACPSSDLAKRTAPRDASPTVELPAGARWKTAKVAVTVAKTERAYSGRNFGTQTTFFVSGWLVLSGAGGETKVRVSTNSEGTTDASAALKAADAKWRIEVLDGGRGIACAKDGDESWRWVALDGPAPFFCPHVRCGPTSGAPAPGAPAREILLAMFASPESRAPHADLVDRDEWNHAAAVATSEPADPELRRALAAAALRKGSGFDARFHEPKVRDPLCAVVASDAGLRQSAIETLGNAAGDLVRAANAASLLGACTDDDVALALAKALIEVFPRKSDGDKVSACRNGFAFTIARIAEARHELPASVSALILPLLTRDAQRGDVALLYLVYAAAVSGNADLRAGLETLSARATGGTPPAWPARLENLKEILRDTEWPYAVPAALFAKAALSR